MTHMTSSQTTWLKWEEATPEDRQAYKDSLSQLIMARLPSPIRPLRLIMQAEKICRTLKRYISGLLTAASKPVFTRFRGRENGNLEWQVVIHSCGRIVTQLFLCESCHWPRCHDSLKDKATISQVCTNGHCSCCEQISRLLERSEENFRSSRSLPSMVDGACDEPGI